MPGSTGGGRGGGGRGGGLYVGGNKMAPVRPVPRVKPVQIRKRTRGGRRR